MATQNISKFKIESLEPTSFSLFNVTREPRAFAPDDIKAACNNLVIRELSDSPVKLSSPSQFFLHYLFTDYFQRAHQSGLYNRQRELFEAIGKVEYGESEPVSYGMFFNKVLWPCNDITLFDKDKNPLIVARVVDEKDSAVSERTDKSNAMDWLRNFVDKLNKLQTRKNCVAGAFFAFVGDFPLDLKARVENLIGVSDPVARYDCKLPPPAMLSLNLLEMHKNGDTAYDDEQEVEDEQELLDYSYRGVLVLPQLKN